MTVCQQRMEQALALRGIAMADLAQRSGVGEDAIARYGTGCCKPTDRDLYLMANALGVSPAWLIGLDLEDEETIEKAIMDLFLQLSEEQQAQAMQYVKTLKEKQERNES